MNRYIPEHAQKVFQGKIFSTYQWKQELFDGTHTTFEAVTRLSIAVMIAVVDGKILIQREEQPGRKPYLSLPAGFAEESDASALDGAKRELLEETGLVSGDWHTFDTYSLYPRMEVTDYIYVARGCTKIQEPTIFPGERQLDSFLYTLDEFIELLDHPEFQTFFLKHHLIRAKYDLSYKEILRKQIFG